MKRSILPLAAFIFGSLFFFSLRGWGVNGGDTEVILSNSWRSILWSDQFTYYLREPLSHFMVHRIYLLTRDFLLSFSIVGALSGGLFLALLTWTSPRPLFWIVCLASATTWSFVGHIEYYAPFNAALALYFVLLTRALEPEPRAKPVHVVAAFALAYFFHKMTLFFMPAMFWLIMTREGGTWARRRWAGRQWEWSLLILIAMAVLDVLPGFLYTYPMAGLKVMYVPLNERFIDLLTPLTPAIARHFEKTSETGMWYVYTFGTPKHLAYFFSFLLAGAPLGLPLLARHWRKIGRSDAACALATAAAIGVIWIFWWQPRSQWKDWDLFCLSGMPINMLAAGLATGMFKGRSAEGGMRNAAQGRETETEKEVTQRGTEEAQRTTEGVSL